MKSVLTTRDHEFLILISLFLIKFKLNDALMLFVEHYDASFNLNLTKNKPNIIKSS